MKFLKSLAVILSVGLCVPAGGWAETVPVFQDSSAVSLSAANSRTGTKKMTYRPKNPSRKGIASWYSETDAYINVHTANGEVFDDTKMTCASWDYAFGTLLEITNLSNGKTVVCRVNDRGPAKRLRRLVDLSKGAFKKIENPRKGLTLVKLRVVPKPSPVKRRAIAAKNLRFA